MEDMVASVGRYLKVDHSYFSITRPSREGLEACPYMASIEVEDRLHILRDSLSTSNRSWGNVHHSFITVEQVVIGLVG